MMHFGGITGKIQIRLTGACPEDCLYHMGRQGIDFWKYEKTDELEGICFIPAGKLSHVQKIARKNMCHVEVISVSGMLPAVRLIGARCCYFGVLLLLLLLVFWLQKHIWFLRVEGNQRIPAQDILESMEACGVGFFTKTDELDLNVVKNQMLSLQPELSWVTVNTQGGIATVVVRERNDKPVIHRDAAPANIVAEKGGVVTEVTVTGGTAQVKPGDIVTEGSLLISGVTDLDKTMLLTKAEGEVYARTWRDTRAILPENRMEKHYTGNQKKRFALTVGKNTINFYKTGGISYSNYDKMAVTRNFTLPGGYTLPISFTVLCFSEYEPQAQPLEEENAAELLRQSSEKQVQMEMQAGTILESSTEVSSQPDQSVLLKGTYTCQEEIGNSVKIEY